MKRSTVIICDTSLLIEIVLFLSIKNWGHYNLIVGLAAVNIFRYSVKYHLDYYKMTDKIY